MLRISVNSWHYKYWVLLRRGWGFQKNPDVTSVCPYCQFIFWASVATLIIAPLAVWGWISIKLIRCIYVIFEKTCGKRITAWLETKNATDWIDELSNDFVERPIIVPFIWGIVNIVIAGLIILLVTAIKMGVIPFILYIPTLIVSIPGWIYWGGMYVGFSIMCVASIPINVLFFVGNKLGLLFCFLGPYLLSILISVAYLVAAGLVVTVVAALGLKLGIWPWFAFKFNGYVEAKTSAKKRAARFHEPRSKKKQKKQGLRYRIQDWLAVSEDELREREDALRKKRKHQGMGFFKTLKEFIKGTKEGVCPIVEFFDENDDKVR